LRELKLRREGDLVFANGKGNIEYHANILNRALIPVQVAAGVVDKDGNPKYTGLHALRHWYASWLINRKSEGGRELPVKVVQARLGHSSITMTMDTYGHLFPGSDSADEQAEAERAFLS
jgi:integrase